MNYVESLDYIYSAKQAGAVKNGLVNISGLLARLGNPEARFPCVHVAGTNGKGSVCAFIESVLRTAGYKTGLFTSPYLERFTERIRLGGREIPVEEFARIATRVRAAADSMARDGLPLPTFFELVTACAFVYFAQEHVDPAVVEVGMGGRTDATNVLTPLVSVITTVGIDHAHTLGGTLELIAAEKAGIIKPGGTCVLSGANGPEVTGVVQRAAERSASRLVNGADYEIHSIRDNLEGQNFDLLGNGLEFHGLEISLLGTHQLANAAAAILALNELHNNGYTISESALKKGLKETRWPGRLELLRREPPVLVDGAHNPQAAQALADGVLRYFGARPACLVVGCMADKDVEPIARQFSRFAARAIATEPPSFGRATQDPEELAGMLRCHGVAASATLDWRDALEQALGSGMAVVIAGSLYLAGAARGWLQSLSAEPSSVGVADCPPSGGSSVGAGVPEGETLAEG